MSSSNTTNAPLMADKDVKATIAQEMKFLEETEMLLESVLEVYREGAEIERYLHTVAQHVARQNLNIRKLDRWLRARERYRRNNDRRVDTETATGAERAEEMETGAEEQPGASKRKRQQSDDDNGDDDNDDDDNDDDVEYVEEETTPGGAPPPVFASALDTSLAYVQAIWEHFPEERDTVVSYLEYAEKHLSAPHLPATSEGVAAWGAWVARQEADERRTGGGSSRSRSRRHRGLRDDSLGELLTMMLDDLEYWHQGVLVLGGVFTRHTAGPILEGIITRRTRGLVADAVAEVQSGHYWSDRLGSCACSGACLLERPI